MNYRRLGRSGLKVSEISLGSWLTYGGYVEQERAASAVRKAYELGVNFFDTANVYEQGAAEKVMGDILRDYPRESYVLATKAFWPMGEGPNDRGLSRKHVTEQINASLSRLGLDYVDIFYCHRYDQDTPIDETLRTIDDFVRQGKVLYVGVSEWTAAQMEEALGTADRYLLDRIVVSQPVYNMFNRYIEKEVIPLGQAKGISQVVFSPLAQGLLTGKYDSASSIPSDSRAAKLEWVKNGITEEKIEAVKKLSAIAREIDLTTGQLALAWILRQPNVASALVGASRPEQVEENVKATGVTLSEETLAAIEEILGSVN
ncbi:aldo/keto reductase family protein [Cohnella herbarum]|uniref:Aldo/keto reductase n=1 Tax=Cohnella herbarum TaxID=2728023 RepID=A0A7Z2VIU1_9BACL|nr:aldo/keto reductase family protein [Cohnella herbarum]QJD83832.1 aldo/keto reductase [Cohnella herbarum]